MDVLSAKTQISLGITQSSLCTQWVAKDPSFLHAESGLIRLGGCPGLSESLQGTHAILLVFSGCGSYILVKKNTHTHKKNNKCLLNIPFIWNYESRLKLQGQTKNYVSIE